MKPSGPAIQLSDRMRAQHAEGRGYFLSTAEKGKKNEILKTGN